MPGLVLAWLDTRLLQWETGAGADFAVGSAGVPAHPSLVFKDAGTRCVDCHLDIHRGQFANACAECHTPATSFLNNNMHDLKLERFYQIGQSSNDFIMMPDGPIKTFTLRGIKDSPPYLHDGRLLTLADTIEFYGTGSVSVTGTESKFSDTDTTFGLFVGYQFVPWLAVEAGWMDLGNTNIDTNGTYAYDTVINPPPLGVPNGGTYSVNPKFESSGWVVSCATSVPLSLLSPM